MTAYGIVPVVNDLAVNHGWDVVGFAINHALYADIALQRHRPHPHNRFRNLHKSMWNPGSPMSAVKSTLRAF